jgi:DNA end-binding protein Ku
MPSRSIWKGSLTFGLVNIPVAVQTITRDDRPRLNQVCRRDSTQIRYKKWCPKEDREVSGDEISYGMRVGTEMIVVSKEELDSLGGKPEREIKILKFVPLEEVPRLYFDKPYLLLPQEKLPTKSFALFLETITRSGRAALGQVFLRNKEHLVLIYPYLGLLIMDTLRFESEIERPEPPRLEATLTKEERALASQLLENLEGEFDIAGLKDESSDRLAALLESKGTRMVVPEAPELGATKAQQLVEALKLSVQTKRRKNDAHDRKHGPPHARVPVEAV